MTKHNVFTWLLLYATIDGCIRPSHVQCRPQTAHRPWPVVFPSHRTDIAGTMLWSSHATAATGVCQLILATAEGFQQGCPLSSPPPHPIVFCSRRCQHTADLETPPHGPVSGRTMLGGRASGNQAPNDEGARNAALERRPLVPTSDACPSDAAQTQSIGGMAGAWAGPFGAPSGQTTPGRTRKKTGKFFHPPPVVHGAGHATGWVRDGPGAARAPPLARVVKWPARGSSFVRIPYFGACDRSGGPPLGAVLVRGRRRCHLMLMVDRICGASPERSASNGVEPAAPMQHGWLRRAHCLGLQPSCRNHPRAGNRRRACQPPVAHGRNGHPNVPGTQPFLRSMTYCTRWLAAVGGGPLAANVARLFQLASAPPTYESVMWLCRRVGSALRTLSRLDSPHRWHGSWIPSAAAPRSSETYCRPRGRGTRSSKDLTPAAGLGARAGPPECRTRW